jgi:predicted AAA+ superfamily ATPase
MEDQSDNHAILTRIADALERLAPPAPLTWPLDAPMRFVWQPEERALMPLASVSALPLDLLQGINRSRDTLLDNTQRFANGHAANNALLWGARGQGKSSLVKAVHAHINTDRQSAERLKLIEVHREDIGSLPHLARSPARGALSGDRLL